MGTQDRDQGAPLPVSSVHFGLSVPFVNVKITTALPETLSQCTQSGEGGANPKSTNPKSEVGTAAKIMIGAPAQRLVLLTTRKPRSVHRDLPCALGLAAACTGVFMGTRVSGISVLRVGDWLAGFVGWPDLCSCKHKHT